MDLKVLLRSPSAHGNLYAALPTPICTSLAERGIFFGVLRIALRRHDPFYAGWGGGSCPVENIGLDSAFAELMHIPSSASVRVSLVAPLDSTEIPPHLTANTVALTPFYDGPHGAQQETFSALAAAGNALELGLLQQIRVVHKDLCFPITLPGNRTVSVRVENATSSDAQSLTNPSYVILVPDSKIIVAPPLPLQRSRIKSPLRSVLRSLPVPTGLQEAYPTYAFVPSELEAYFLSRNADFICTYVSVANKGEVGRAVSIPIATCGNEQVPEGHVFVPDYIFNILAVPVLTPIRLEESFDNCNPPSSLRMIAKSTEWVLSEDGDDGYSIDSFDALHVLRLPTIVFPGMKVGKVHIACTNAEKSLQNSRQSKWNSLQLVTELWDREWKEKNGEKVRAESSSGESGAKPEDLGRTTNVTLVSVPAWHLSREVKVKTVGELNDELAIAARHSRLETQRNDIVPQPVRLSQVPGEFCRTAILNIILEAQKVILPKKGFTFGSETALSSNTSASSLIVLEGPQGSGKTFALCRVAAILREKARARTVWIRCQYHRGEPEHASRQRIGVAFKAAADGGPGILVFDDADVFFSGTVDRTPESNPEEGSAAMASRRKLAQYLIRNMESHRGKPGGPVLVILACTKAQRLDERLRSPSVIANVVGLDLPSSTDRAAVLAFNNFRHVHVQTMEPSVVEEKQQRQLLNKVATLTEGFNPQDLVVLVERTKVQVTMNRNIDSNEDYHPNEMLSEMVKLASSMTPMSRKGIRFDDASEEEGLTWDDIGGLEQAKSIIKETLELPSQYPDIFASSPIRQKRGILLYGPSGCGKSILAVAAANACGMRKICIRGPELLSKYIGESEAEVRRVFERATAIRPCVIIFDEFDSLAPRRGGESTGVADRVVNTLLTALDGVEELAKGVFVIATTSRPETIDPALLRPGRLDLWVAVDLPKTIDDRLKVVSSISRSFNSGLSMDGLRSIAEHTDGYSGADLKGVLVEFQLAKKRLLELHSAKAYPAGDTFNIDDEALLIAMQETRPSISVRERRRYKRVMAQFGRSRSSDQEQGEKADDVLPGHVTHATDVLRRVALK